MTPANHNSYCFPCGGPPVVPLRYYPPFCCEHTDPTAWSADISGQQAHAQATAAPAPARVPART